jgi:ligand-binding SRPBCC domain-containing protein
MGYYTKTAEQKIPASIETIWEFMSSPKNLKKITPAYMGFDIISPNANDPIYPGMIITYKVSPLLGIKMDWVTEITHVKEGIFFVDEQRLGPYSMWHHQHHIEAIPGGVLMRDIVTYIPPMWLLGDIANSIMIKSKLNEIFKHRFDAVEQLFGVMP